MKDSTAEQSNAPEKLRLLPLVALAAIILGYLFLTIQLHPGNFFGLTEDDTLYLSSAKSLAEGNGYILPSVPGTPPATKYPILYPWILSWVWRWNSQFPANLSAATAVNLAFGAAYLAAAFLFIRRLPGFNSTVALLLTAVCAFNPRVIFLSANLISDIPFAALALGACVAAARASDKEARQGPVVICAVLTGLAILTRALGIPIAAGLFVAMAIRIGWRKALTFAAGVAPFVVGFFWRSLLIVPKIQPATASSCQDSWRMTWLYYTSYTGFWRADVLSNGLFWQTVRNDLLAAVFQPASYLVKMNSIGIPVLAVALMVVLSMIALRGGVRLVSAGGWQPIHIALGFYLLPVLVWDYAVMDRFLLPFLPLICAGISWEVRQVVTQVRSAAAGKQPLGVAIAAVFFCVCGAALLWAAGVSWFAQFRTIARDSDSRAELLVEKREAYNWLKENSQQEAKVLAYEDASLFLYSVRKAIRPVIFSPAGANRPEILKRDLSCVISSAQPTGAEYWLVSDDDFGYEWEPANSRGREREKEMEVKLHPLFRSRQGGVRIYKLNANDAAVR